MNHSLVAAALAAAFFIVPAPVRGQAPDTLALSMEDAVALALRTGDQARTARAQVDVAEAQIEVARATGLPQLRLNGNYSHVYESSRGQAVGALFNQPNTYSSSASFSQTIFQGGRVFAGVRAANRVRQATRLSEQDVRAQVSLDVQRAYLDVLFANRLLDIQTANAALASARLAQTVQLESAGRAARYDVLRARVERANLDPLVLQAQSDRDIALLNLKRLLDIPLAQPVALTTAIDADAASAVLASIAADTADTATDRASVRAAELTALARHDAITVARADLLPTVSLSFNYGFGAFPRSGLPLRAGATEIDTIPCSFVTVDGSACTRTSQNGGLFSDKSFGVQVSWPIFDGLATKGAIDLAQAQAQLADIQLKQEREQVALEVAQAQAELRRARASFGTQQQNSAEAREAFQLASLRFNRGLGTQLEVSDAQIALLTAETTEARATYDLYLAAAGLARALGKPLPMPPGTPSSPGGGAGGARGAAGALQTQTLDSRAQNSPF